MARRSFCSQAHAVSYDPNPRTRCRPNADIPFFCDVRNQIAANHVDNGVRIRWKIVPTVTDVCRPQAAHIHLPFAVCHARVEGRADEAVRPPQSGQVLEAGPIVGEPRLELLERPRIVDAADRMRANRG